MRSQSPQSRITQAKISLVLKFRQFDLYWFRKDKEEDKEEGGGEIRVRAVGKGRRRREGGGGDRREGGKRDGGRKKERTEGWGRSEIFYWYVKEGSKVIFILISRFPSYHPNIWKCPNPVMI